MQLQNPIPDYYAEKVRSVADYRTWIKKQRDVRIKFKILIINEF